MWKIYDLHVEQDDFEVSLLLEDARHATNLFTVEARHANLLGRLGPIFFVDGKRWASIACM